MIFDEVRILSVAVGQILKLLYTLLTLVFKYGLLIRSVTKPRITHLARRLRAPR